MKKFYSFLVAAVLLMGATSCQKEATADAGAADNVEFVASIAGGRTELGAGNKVMWNANDNIRIFTQENLDGNIFNSDATAATATAKFTTTEQFTPSNNGYLAVYPETANTGNATCEDGVWSIPVSMKTEFSADAGDVVPAANYYEENNFMVAFSENNQLSFKAATALLKFTYTGNQGFPIMFFTGEDRVTGDAVLQFNTADNSISYEEADGTQISLDGLVNGNVYYVPVYPGKISSITITEQMQTLLSVNKEIELKAGRIYNLDMPAGMSPWMLYDSYGEGTPIAVSKEGDFHVAKNVPANTNGYIFSKDGMQSSFAGAESTTTAFEQWGFTGNEAFYLTEGQNFDIYLTDDASLYFIAPAGTPIENIPAIAYSEEYFLYDYQADATVKLLDMGDFYVAKNMPSSENYVIIDQEFNMYGIAADWAEPGTWYELGGVADMATYKPFMLESDAYMPCTLYLSADGKWMGYEKPYYPALPAVPTQSAWGLVGSHQGWDVANVTTMWTKGNFAVAENVVFDSATEFKFVIRNNNSDWSSAVGYPWRNITSNSAYSLVNWTFENESNNITLAAGTYDIYLATTSNDAPAYFVVVDKGASTVLTSTDIYIHARNTESDWNTSAMEFDGTYFVKKDVSFSSGIEFLFKATPDAWNIKWCGITNATLNAANTLKMYNDANITNTNSGTYDIYTDLKSVWIMNSGSYPEN